MTDRPTTSRSVGYGEPSEAVLHIFRACVLAAAAALYFGAFQNSAPAADTVKAAAEPVAETQTAMNDTPAER